LTDREKTIDENLKIAHNKIALKKKAPARMPGLIKLVWPLQEQGPDK